MHATPTVCLIGAGPRGLSVLERLCADARAAGTTAEVHVVDPYPPGAGRVWTRAQSRHLLMNTVADQISVFTDDSVQLAGPVREGPTLYEWATGRLPADSPDSYDDGIRAEARDLGPDTYPTRALYGHYLDWAFRWVANTAAGSVAVLVHRATAVALDDEPGDLGRPGGPRQRVRLDDGTRLEGLDAVVLAQGHLSVLPSAAEREVAAFADRHGLVHLPAGNPAEADLSGLDPGRTVLLRGLGLSFFDLVTLLTTGRGGRFTRSGDRLVYHPSGLEPRLVAGSRRGVPYHARGENEKGRAGRHEPLLLTPDRIAALRAAGPGLDFRTDVWPLVAREVEIVYYCARLAAAGRGAEVPAVRDGLLAVPPGADPGPVLDGAGVPGPRWDWLRIARPYAGERFAGPAEFDRWLLDHLDEDVRAARAGNVAGPVKAALDVLRDLRNEIRDVVDHGGLHGASYRDDLERWYTPLNAYLSIGPPVRRVEELAALLRAGVVRLVGPETTVTADPAAGRFVAASPLVPGSRIAATALVEARIPEVSLSRTADPLLRHLLATGQCRRYSIPDRHDGRYHSEGLAVTGRPYRLLDAAGRAHPRRFAFGVPTEAVHWATAAGIRPGVGSVTLADSDAIARAALRCARPVPSPEEVPV